MKSAELRIGEEVMVKATGMLSPRRAVVTDFGRRLANNGTRTTVRVKFWVKDANAYVGAEMGVWPQQVLGYQVKGMP